MTIKHICKIGGDCVFCPVPGIYSRDVVEHKLDQLQELAYQWYLALEQIKEGSDCRWSNGIASDALNKEGYDPDPRFIRDAEGWLDKSRFTKSERECLG